MSLITRPQSVDLAEFNRPPSELKTKYGLPQNVQF